ncbi:MAG: molybdate ABC transporter substrate-binding protein [Myxococcota bacterium]
MKRRFTLAAALTFAVGCSSSASSEELTVFAAASLTEAFEAIIEDFEREHVGVDVRVSFAGSNSLRTQIENGARADVFASANPKHLRALEDQRLAMLATVFATNQMVVAVPEDNPAHIEIFDHLPKAERIVLAGSEVPAGAYAQKIIGRAASSLGPQFSAAVMKQVVSRENDVRATLQKVVLGEADAALVYETDAAAADVSAVEIPSDLNVRASYPIAPLAEGDRALAQRFVSFVTSLRGQETLERFGFGLPSEGMSASR